MNTGGVLSPRLCESVPARTLLSGTGSFGEQRCLGVMLVREKVENLNFSCHWVPSGIKDQSAWPKAGYVFTVGLLFKGSKIALNKKIFLLVADIRQAFRSVVLHASHSTYISHQCFLTSPLLA